MVVLCGSLCSKWSLLHGPALWSRSMVPLHGVHALWSHLVGVPAPWESLLHGGLCSVVPLCGDPCSLPTHPLLGLFLLFFGFPAGAFPGSRSRCSRAELLLPHPSSARPARCHRLSLRARNMINICILSMPAFFYIFQMQMSIMKRRQVPGKCDFRDAPEGASSRLPS